jgi:hypothetical protein
MGIIDSKPIDKPPTYSEYNRENILSILESALRESEKMSELENALFRPYLTELTQLSLNELLDKTYLVNTLIRDQELIRLTRNCRKEIENNIKFVHDKIGYQIQAPTDQFFMSTLSRKDNERGLSWYNSPVVDYYKICQDKLNKVNTEYNHCLSMSDTESQRWRDLRSKLAPTI